MAKMPAKPKKPKVSASAAAWEKFDDRMKAYNKKCADLISARKKKDSLIKKYS